MTLVKIKKKSKRGNVSHWWVLWMMLAGWAGFANRVNWWTPHLREARLAVHDPRFLKGHICSPSFPFGSVRHRDLLHRVPQTSLALRQVHNCSRTRSLIRTHAFAAPAFVSPRNFPYAFTLPATWRSCDNTDFLNIFYALKTWASLM